ncbi:MAG: hypothetical protein GEU75_04045 [Dehalococcoidia bacterium]|nr:hypothetical protein [Dehalococcoidia bacterium]
MPFMKTLWWRTDQRLPRTPCVFGLMDAGRTQMIYLGQAQHLDDAIAEIMADPSHKAHQFEPKIICAETNAMEDVRQRRYQVLISEYNPPANA